MLGRDGCPLNVSNIVAQVDANASEVVDIIQEIIDDPEHDIPGRVVTGEDVARVQELMAYYGNWFATLIGLWAKVRIKAGKDSNRIAARDVLEEQHKACFKKYEAASRALTTFQERNKGQHERIF